MLEPNE